VNEAVSRRESGMSYYGRPHGPAAGRRVETEYEARNNASHEGAAEAIVP
jgi:hypothetical protein